jgi:hypothetical protein
VTTILSKHCSSSEETQLQRFEKIWKMLEDLVHDSQKNFGELDRVYCSLKGHFEQFANVWCPGQLTQLAESLNILRDNCVQESAFVQQNLNKFTTLCYFGKDIIIKMT